jgi:pantoate--beta-alanine ligase
MLIFTNQAALLEYLQPFYTQNISIGLVPTMGALHDGHLSLLQNSINENKLTVISIFVNPTQFNNANDLEKYPRNLEKDVEKIEVLYKDILIFAPTVNDIYEGKTVSASFDYDGLEHQMEGKHRLGHFNGVGTIVKKLFDIVQPTRAYFGEKDFQQLQIVKKLVEKQKMKVEIIGIPIYREKNGLAMSSRNERLTDSEKEKAGVIFKILNQSKILFATKSANEVEKWVENEFTKQTHFRLEYFEIADEKTLKPCNRKNKNTKYRAFIAVFVNEIRLIDTISLN